MDKISVKRHKASEAAFPMSRYIAECLRKLKCLIEISNARSETTARDELRIIKDRQCFSNSSRALNPHRPFELFRIFTSADSHSIAATSHPRWTLLNQVHRK